MNIGENVKRIREEHGITQAELAKAVCVAQSMITQIERGTKALSMQLAVQMAQYFDVPITEFIDA